MDLDELSDEQLSDLIEEAKAVLARRQSAAELDRQLGDLLGAAREGGVATAPESGAEWVQPTSAVDAYLKGDVVTYEGARWVATTNFNTWRPGEAGWRKLPDEDGTPADYVQPSGAADAYQTGDRVSFEGGVYEAVQDGVVWSPAEHPAAWRKVD